MSKKKYVIRIFFIIITSIIVLCSNINTNADKSENIVSNINDSIQLCCKNNPKLGLSSNPYDYIEKNDYYDSLIEGGVENLPILLNALENSEDNGLSEYIIAIAIEEIYKMNLKKNSYDWQEAKGFLKLYNHTVYNRKNIIKNIILYNDNEEIIYKDLNYYGYIAFSVLYDFHKSSDFDEEKMKMVDDIYNKMISEGYEEKLIADFNNVMKLATNK